MNVCMVPVPPSANRMYRIIRGRMYRSSDYMAWLDVAVDCFRRNMRPVEGPAEVEIVLSTGKGVTVRSDIDNLVKPVLDALQPPSIGEDGNVNKPGAGIIQGDDIRLVQKITTLVVEGDRTTDAFLEVRVFEAHEHYAITFAPRSKRKKVAP